MINEHRFITTTQLADKSTRADNELEYLDRNELTRKEKTTTEIDDEIITNGFHTIIEIARNYYKDFNIEINRIPTIKWTYDSDERAGSTPDQISITLKPLSSYEQEGIIVDDAFKKFRALYVLDMIAHEFYHAICQEVVDIRPKKKNFQQLILQTLYGKNHWHFGKYQYSRVRWGIAYKTKLNQSSKFSSLEEGLAMRFEENCLQELLALPTFSEVAQNFQSIRSMVQLKYMVPISSINVSPVWFALQRQDDNFFPEDVFVSYVNSITFESYIKESLEEAGYNYLLLIENARMLHKTLPLARAITKVFGKGAYRMIIEAREEDCVESLSKLKRMKKYIV